MTYRDSANGNDLGVACLASQVPHLLNHSSVVCYRLRVGHRVDTRVPTAGSRLRSGEHGFGVFFAGFAQVGVQVDQAGKGDEAGSVDRSVRVVDVWNDSTAVNSDVGGFATKGFD